MTTSWPARAIAALAALALSICVGCAYHTGQVVLLPEKDGSTSTLEVRQGGQTFVLDKPYAATRQWPLGPQAYASDQKEVEARFGSALGAQPMRAKSFTLYFLEGQDEFTAESKENFEKVFAEIGSYPVPDLVVVGHTDKVGSDPFNDALSLRRAEAVRSALVARGVAPTNIVAVGRGKREPLIPTADGVAEPRNRRVEILVR
jgi:outer membrane protein OmpA-like peptidoglycan-associated protein